jgi:Cytochrome b/b6/petB/Cytochrome c oxidase subunit III
LVNSIYSRQRGIYVFHSNLWSRLQGLYYGSYTKPRQLLRCSGVVLLFLMMATAFTGYVLPWGQKSLWDATVITSMVTVIPVADKYILQWLWGGYTIKTPTFHSQILYSFVLPFLIAGFTLIHIALLHKVGSSRPVKPHSFHIKNKKFNSRKDFLGFLQSASCTIFMITVFSSAHEFIQYPHGWLLFVYFQFRLFFKDHLSDDLNFWPFLAFVGGFMFTTGLVLYMYRFTHGWLLLLTGLILIICVMYAWWRDGISSHPFLTRYSGKTIQRVLLLVIILYIVLETVFFFAFFVIVNGEISALSYLLVLVLLPYRNIFKTKNRTYSDLKRLLVCLLLAIFFSRHSVIAPYIPSLISEYDCCGIITYGAIIGAVGILLTAVYYAFPFKKFKSDYDEKDLQELPWGLFFSLSACLVYLCFNALDDTAMMPAVWYFNLQIETPLYYNDRIPFLVGEYLHYFFHFVCYSVSAYLLFFKHPPRTNTQKICWNFFVYALYKIITAISITLIQLPSGKIISTMIF